MFEFFLFQLKASSLTTRKKFTSNLVCLEVFFISFPFCNLRKKNAIPPQDGENEVKRRAFKNPDYTKGNYGLRGTCVLEMK